MKREIAALSAALLLSACASSLPSVPMAAPAPARVALDAGQASCALGGDARVLAPRAQVKGMAVGSTDDHVTLQFASRPRTSVGLRLDPGSLEATAEPAPAPAPSIDPHDLWVIPPAPVRDLRVTALDGGARVLAFRHEGALVVGEVDADSHARGAVTWIEARDMGPGAPAVAASGASVMVAWVEGGSTEPSARFALARKTLGGALGPVRTMPVPAGGFGGGATSPELAAIGDGHFLLVWTEGPVWRHQIRAVTLDSDGTPLGEAVTVSGDRTAAGWGRAAVTQTGNGVVVFLSSTVEGFEIVATPVWCPRTGKLTPSLLEALRPEHADLDSVRTAQAVRPIL